MTPTVVAVRPEAFTAAAREFEEIHDRIASIMTLLATTLSSSTAMAGTDSGGATFAGAYDPLVNGADGGFAGLALLSNAAGKMTELLDASAVNHIDADTALAQCTPETPSGVVRAPHTVIAPSVGSAFGGSGEPSNWEQISAFVEGMVFPDGDPEALDRVAGAWRLASSTLTDEVPRIRTAISHITGEVSAEVEPARGQAEILADSTAKIAGVLDSIATLCSNYAEHVREVRNETADAVTELACELVATAAIGIGLMLVTAGLSGVLASAAGAARATATGAKIAGYIRTFLSAADVVIRPVMYMLDPIAAAAGDLGGLMGSRAVIMAGNSTSSIVRANSLAEALRRLPHWQHDKMELAADPAKLADRLYEDGMPRELAERAASESPYHDLSAEQIVDKYWDNANSTWKWPPNNGFAETPTISDRFPEGLQMDRLGDNNGGFLGAQGDSYASRALSPGTDQGYSSYEGTGKALPEGWELRDGTVAPAFGQPGGGHQWVVMDTQTGQEISLETLLDGKYLIEN